ncbi:MAG: hypothetical protein JW709_00390 [Sedimentisphaerales bacterium]|nr:hypothetical protein [Sedimentisphaerales bacterium]
MASWRTTLLGILGGLAIIIKQLIGAFDDDPATVFSLTEILAALGMLGLGIFARDNKVSSESAGAT